MKRYTVHKTGSWMVFDSYVERPVSFHSSKRNAEAEAEALNSGAKTVPAFKAIYE